MRALKHIPLDQWPEADRQAFELAYKPGDIFDGTTGPGAHLADGTRQKIETSYRRWLGYLKDHDPAALEMAPADRITRERLRCYVEVLRTEVRGTSVSINIDDLHYAARLVAPGRDWGWLRALKSRLAVRVRRQDRFQRLVPPWQLLDLGIELMDSAVSTPDLTQSERDRQYRDGMLIALLSQWPIRRRSIAALTLSRHVLIDPDGMTLLLHPEDTKSKRSEGFRVPVTLLAPLQHYLNDVRPRFRGALSHDGLWASMKGRPLSDSWIYAVFCARVLDRFGKRMSLHDVRRAAATYIAMDAPEKVGMIPGVLQHNSSEVAEHHYNLARSTEASRRYAETIAMFRARLERGPI